LAGKIEKAVKVKGLGVTKGAKAAIEAAGGSIEE
jgi:ribosomal protein L18e/L15